MAQQYLLQTLDVGDVPEDNDNESLEDFIEEEEVDSLPVSTFYSNKLIDLSLSAKSEAQKKEEEKVLRTGTSSETTALLEAKVGVSYLHALSVQNLREGPEENCDEDDEEEDSDVAESSTSALQRRLSTGETPKQTVTVFSKNPPASQRRDSQGSSELPVYVKNMMEKDASLRRLLKTGCVTISQINQPARMNRRTLSNITITKTGGGLMTPMSGTSNGAGSKYASSSTSSQPGPSVIRKSSELDWTGFPAAQKFLQFANLTRESNEAKSIPGPSKVLASEPVHRATPTAKVFQVPMPTFSSSPSSASVRQVVQRRAQVVKPAQSASASSSKQAIKLTGPVRRFISGPVSVPARVGMSTLHPKAQLQPPLNKIPSQTKTKFKPIAPRPVPVATKQEHHEDDLDPTRFLEVSFMEEEHQQEQTGPLSDEHRRKYKCPHCPKAFCWSTDLKRHILTHTGERPFKCTYCSANFTRKFLMQKHVRKYHPGMEECLVTKPNTVSVSNGKKPIAKSATNGIYTVPKLKAELIAHADYDEDEIPDGMEVDYNDEINFKHEYYENADADGHIIGLTEEEQELENSYQEADDEYDESEGKFLFKEEMLEDDDDGDDYIDFPEPQQFFTEEDDEDELEQDPLHDEGIEEVQPAQEYQHQHLLQQKYSLGKKFTNIHNVNNGSSSSSGSSPIVINVFSTSKGPVKRLNEGGDFTSTTASPSIAPRHLSQALVNQLALASAKLKGEMAKTTSAREALRLLVRR